MTILTQNLCQYSRFYFIYFFYIKIDSYNANKEIIYIKLLHFKNWLSYSVLQRQHLQLFAMQGFH